MTNKEKRKRVEALMKATANELIESRKRYAEAIMDDSVPNPIFYVESEEDPTVFEKSTSRHGVNTDNSTKRFLRRIGAIAAVLVVALGLTVTVSAEARKWIYNAVFEAHEDHYVVVFGPIDKEAPVYKDFVVSYVPAGYEIATRDTGTLENDNTIFYEEYSIGDDVFCIDIAPRESMSLFIDNERAEHTDVEFDGIHGHYYRDGRVTCLMWTDGRYEYIISGTLSLEEYISISTGIKGIK